MIGVDRKGSPVCYIHVKQHQRGVKSVLKIGAQTQDEIEKLTIWIMETARLFIKEPVETASFNYFL